MAGGTGSGKSSLLRALTGTLRELQGGHVSGRLDVRLEDGSAPRIGYLPQDPLDGLLGFDASTEFRLRLQADGWAHREAAVEAGQRLRALGYEAKEEVPLGSLSGGERKRLALRANRVHEPHLLLLDEPLNHLDAHWRSELLEDVLAASGSGLVIVADHEVDRWLPVAKQVLVLRGGSLYWEGEPAAFERVRDEFPELLSRDRAARFVSPPRHHGPSILRAVGLRAGRGHPLFRELSIELPAGLHAIVGPNGSGKTTLLQVLAGLRAPDEGRVLLGPTDLKDLTASERAHRIGVLFEQPGRHFFLPRLREEIEYQPRNAGRTPFEAETLARRAAERFHATALLELDPGSLSGGQQERAGLACLEAAAAAVLVLDEPTQGLDANGWDDLVDFIERHRQDACIVVATHDDALITLADTVHLIEEGQLRPVRLGTANAMVEVVLRRS